MTTDQEARERSAEAIERVFSDSRLVLDYNAPRILCGISRLESRYGDGWKGAGKGSRNKGAIQAGPDWKGDVFLYTDTHPNPDGSSTSYSARFRAYATEDEAWDDLVRVAFGNKRRSVLAAAITGDVYSVSEQLRATGYFEGFGATVRDRVYNHFIALRKGILLADPVDPLLPAEMLLRGMPTTIPPTVLRGSRGEAVGRLQLELGLVADNVFGPVTEETLRTYQETHGLTPDRKCGPLTWQTLFSDNYVPEAA